MSCRGGERGLQLDCSELQFKTLDPCLFRSSASFGSTHVLWSSCFLGSWRHSLTACAIWSPLSSAPRTPILGKLLLHHGVVEQPHLPPPPLLLPRPAASSAASSAASCAIYTTLIVSSAARLPTMLASFYHPHPMLLSTIYHFVIGFRLAANVAQKSLS